MQITIEHGTKQWVLTDEASGGSYGQPVLIDATGRQYGPWDIVVDTETRGELGYLSGSRIRARAIASYASDDHPDNPDVLALVRKFLDIPA